MAATLRRFLPLRSSFQRTTSFTRSGAGNGFGRIFRCYNAVASSEQTLLKFEEEDRLIKGDDELGFNEELAKIRHEFDAAKQKFLKIPEALKGMPKMNPEHMVNKLDFFGSIEPDGCYFGLHKIYAVSVDTYPGMTS